MPSNDASRAGAQAEHGDGAPAEAGTGGSAGSGVMKSRTIGTASRASETRIWNTMFEPCRKPSSTAERWNSHIRRKRSSISATALSRFAAKRDRQCRMVW